MVMLQLETDSLKIDDLMRQATVRSDMVRKVWLILSELVAVDVDVDVDVVVVVDRDPS